MIKVLALSFLFFSCNSKTNFTGVWFSKYPDLYSNTIIQIFDNKKVIMSNLPHETVISFDNVVIDNLAYFDSGLKEGKFDKQNKKICYKNFSKDEDAIIVFYTSTEMEILFHNGTICHLKKITGNELNPHLMF